MRGRVFIAVATAAIVPAGRARADFPQGVASGDVTDSTAVIWSRTDAERPLRADLATDDQFQAIVATQTFGATEDTDFTVHFDAAGLTPATTYFYRFVELDTATASPTGRFQTAPSPDEARPFRFVYTGDSNARFRPFHVLTHAAAEEPDLWFWAGDTAYTDSVADGLAVATDLAGYRAKHRQNREDAALRALLAAAPVLVQWDDHEVANDYDGGDLEPHLTRGRVEAGYQAFFESMPIRRQDVPADPFRIYRSVRYGALAEFFILDCRQYRSRDAGRDGGGPDPRAFLLPTLEFETIGRLLDPQRTMLGAEQLAWLKDGLRSSTARWKFILSSVPFTSLLFLPYDRWDGYVAERYDLLRFIDENDVTGVVLLSADIHGNVYNPDVTRFLRETWLQSFSPCFRVPEFIAGPIATDTIREELALVGSLILGASPMELEPTLLFAVGFQFLASMIVDANDIAFLEPDRFAYLVVDVTPDGITLTHRGIPSAVTPEIPPIETLSTVTLADPASPMCGAAPLLPICLCAAATRTPKRYPRRKRS